jgi:hypothetical protein
MTTKMTYRMLPDRANTDWKDIAAGWHTWEIHFVCNACHEIITETRNGTEEEIIDKCNNLEQSICCECRWK